MARSRDGPPLPGRFFNACLLPMCGGDGMRPCLGCWGRRTTSPKTSQEPWTVKVQDFLCRQGGDSVELASFACKRPRASDTLATQRMNARPGSSGPAGRKNRHLSGWALAGIVLLLMAVLGAAWVASPRPADPRALVDKRLLVSKGTYVQLASVAPQLREAVVATEDERFWRHHGIDVIGLARAAGYDVSHASLAQGASTITEQLGKDLYLGGDDRTPWRKLEDAALAVRLEAQ